MPTLTDDQYLESIFVIVGESVMLLNGRGSVKWIPADDDGDKEPIQMDLAEYVMRSLASTLIEKGHDYEQVKKVAQNSGIEISNEPYHSVIFKSLAGKRRLTRRKQSKKQ